METTLHTSFREWDHPTAYCLIDMAAACVGDQMGEVFKRLYVLRQPEKDVKRWLHGEGFSHRQARGLIVDVKSRINSQREVQKADIKKWSRKIRDAKRQIKGDTPDWLVKQLEGKIARWQNRIDRTTADLKRDVPSFCFGSKELFRKQHHLKENGLTLEQWREAWWQHRHEQFLCVGSKDETMGNQTCQVVSHLVTGSLKDMELRCTVRLKLPPCVCDSWADIPLSFKYGAAKLEPILRALDAGDEHCLSWRFIIDRERRAVRVHVSFTEQVGPVRLVPDAVMGSDMNEDFLELAAVSRKTGNRIWFKREYFRGKSAQETKDNLNRIIRECMELCRANNWAFACEDLEFEGKKARDLGTRMNKMLSQWLTGHYQETVERWAARFGVLAVAVNPAFTSVIGEIKFSTGYGWSRHQGAAVVIARRALGFSERARSVKPGEAVELAKIRKPHVWGVWARAKPAPRVGGTAVVPAALAGSPKGTGAVSTGAACGGPSPPLGP